MTFYLRVTGFFQKRLFSRGNIPCGIGAGLDHICVRSLCFKILIYILIYASEARLLGFDRKSLFLNFKFSQLVLVGLVPFFVVLTILFLSFTFCQCCVLTLLLQRVGGLLFSHLLGCGSAPLFIHPTLVRLLGRTCRRFLIFLRGIYGIDLIGEARLSMRDRRYDQTCEN